jgi:hypothetical protein
MASAYFFLSLLFLITTLSSYAALVDPHLLSSLLAVFALAVLDDPGRLAATDPAQEYYILAWVAFHCTFPARVATMSLVETLVR